MQLCTFQLGGMWFGIDARLVQEVLRRQELTPVPLAATHVAGLLNIRGQIVTALRLHERMGLPDSQKDPLHVVVRSNAEAISLIVDAIGGVVDVTSEIFEQVPPTTPAALKPMLVGAYKLPDRLVLVPDIETVVA
jgi:purine-binding chemotaxis protein CheW